ncbi:MMPL family transporter [Motilibacter aurantiacus]|uniref:MMPL family transporter n=1 Tax=Motilibacter aurantiacus TaxID=2714955 RepID=UPI001407FDCD|nr:MMPL family transporter [Motilibacter aurantiacus]NHC47280.1 MMPL family transporter [Motilibacter aurantiacus]
MERTTPTLPAQPSRRAARAPRGRVTRVAAWSAAHRKTALIAWIVFVALAVVLGGAAGTKTLEGSEDGSGESARVDKIVEGTSFGERPTESLLVSQPDGGQVGPEAEEAAAALRSRAGALSEVSDVEGPIRSPDGTTLLVRAVLAVPADADSERADEIAYDAVPAVQAMTAAVQADHPGVRVEQVGGASLGRAADELIGDDFKRAELTSIPVTLVILVVVFGALVAAAVPVLLALSAVGAAIGLSALASHIVPVGDLLASVILLIGMAVGVDYSLFYVRREREERARGAKPRDAIERAAETAGHTVVVSGIAVIVAMAGLFLSGSGTFVSFGIGTIIVVAVAMLGSVTVLPALLALLGDKLDRPRMPFLHKRAGRAARIEARRNSESRFWSFLLRPVLAHPKAALVAAGGALLVLAMPVLGLKLGNTGMDDLPRSVAEVRAYDRLVGAFPSEHDAHTVIVASTDGAPLDEAAVSAALNELAGTASQEPDFAPVDAADRPEPELSRDGTVARIDVPIGGSSQDREGKDTLEALRDRLGPAALGGLAGTTWGVTGDTAWTVDFIEVLKERLPVVLLFVLALTFLVLVVSFRAPVVAAVAIGLNLLSVGAAYGLLVLVFQNTWAEGLLDFRSNGSIVSWMPLFSFVILFGLSMDYTVLVVSRVREALQHGASAQEAVRTGIVRTAGVVTSAAAIMIAVFAIFGTLHLLEFKQLGIGLAAAILIDATIVRAVLLPAALALLGERAWGGPRWLGARPVRPLAPEGSRPGPELVSA